MKEIPLPLVKSNQVGIVIVAILSIIIENVWLVAALWVIQVLGLLLGLRFNLFVSIARPFLQLQGKDTQSAELARFNNALAVTFLTLSLISFAISQEILAYVFVGMLAAAALLALLGYCIGCTIYYQIKRLSRSA
jgi:hypothetical protein